MAAREVHRPNRQFTTNTGMKMQLKLKHRTIV